VAAPDSVQGRSLVPLLDGAPAAWRDSAFAENLWSNAFGNPRCESVRTRRWKYIRYFANDRSLFGKAGGKGANRVTPEQARAYAGWLSASIRGEEPVYEELFDLERDPGETANLAADPAHAAVLDRHRAEARRLVRQARGDLDVPPTTVTWLDAEGEGGGRPR
jgi:arylsulfatase A-like enzyme